MDYILSKIRREYGKYSLDVKFLTLEPIELFCKWLDDAKENEIEPTAMLLATSTSDGQPSSRIVLLKSVEKDSFVFFTNYLSRKGSQIKENKHISATFFWPYMERQVHIEGEVEKLTDEYSDIYFHSRPWKSRIGAIVSKQSQVISSRGVLIGKFMKEAFNSIFKGKIDRPKYWGGYKIIPNRIEFWQGRKNRLHDRILYTINEKNDDNVKWEINRLSP